jgi:hypothetical protein
LSLQYADYWSFKCGIASIASTSRHLNEENVLDILNEPDEYLISDSSDVIDDNEDCEDDITVADAADDEEGQGHSLGDVDC